MRKRELTHLTALFTLAILARVLVFDKVAIWGDMGFYQYDARLILGGGTPFIDFLGRSPVFNYLYAGAVAAFGHPTELVRVFMHFWWLLTAVPVYLITRRIRGHRSGIAALAIFLLLPFPLTYGSWANTQSVAAFFGVTGVWLLVRSRSIPSYAGAGALFGVAYLSRRSIIVVLFAVLLYTAYSYLRYDWDGLKTVQVIVARNAAVSVAFLAAIFGIYGAMARFDPETTWALFEVHTINLFFSFGRGGYPLLGVDAPIVTNELSEGHIPIFNDICQMCGKWTAKTFAKTIMATVPVIGLLSAYVRDWTLFYFSEREKQYMWGILGILAVYGMVTAWMAGYHLRTFVVISITLFVWLVYSVDAISRDILYQRDMQLILIVLCGLTAGYLYRRRVLHTYYFMDFWPYLSVVVGVIGVRVWELADEHSRELMIVAVVLGTIAATVGSHPLMVVVMYDNEPGWFTMNNIHDYQQDLNDRTEPADRVLASNPSYVALSHAEMPMDRPRLHMVAVRYESNGPGGEQYATLNEGIRNGKYEYAIVSRTIYQMLGWNETFRELFLSHYCRVESSDSLYQRTNAYLYEWVGSDSDCPERLEPDMDRMYNATKIGGV